MDPITLALILAAAGGGIGALTNHKHPIKGGLIGAGLGAAGGAGLGAMGVGAAGAGAGSAAGGIFGDAAASGAGTAATAGGGASAGGLASWAKMAPMLSGLMGKQQQPQQLPPMDTSGYIPEPIAPVTPPVNGAMVPQIQTQRMANMPFRGGYSG